MRGRFFTSDDGRAVDPIKLLMLDVDGVLTDGSLPYLADGKEFKTFHVQDGSAIKLWQKWGGIVAIVSGRSVEVVNLRAKGLGIETVIQGVADKLAAYESLLARFGLTDAQAAVVGDDHIDIPPMARCAWPFAVANAVPAAKRSARHVTRRRGGEGAIAEVVERLLRVNGVWREALAGMTDR